MNKLRLIIFIIHPIDYLLQIVNNKRYRKKHLRKIYTKHNRLSANKSVQTKFDAFIRDNFKAVIEFLIGKKAHTKNYKMQ